ncbi:hypothetical protein K227x_23970 [Rubripirellula lacrimiformis]|uniref:Calcineurin-like phosphoesterase domain-containing protein n=1 Tax=Rubripirellula lacrimiformis TaxID=1930273 RepID=A0A517NA50_9BACT|nr:metallophosphoesterase [Rubripirellula lacrimiformis]QDT04011.1 hypothetical protein K227x_23970 [Rubripirellula lacrimiformis]
MSSNSKHIDAGPRYQGQKWIGVDLPKTVCDWSVGGEQSIVTDGDDHGEFIRLLSKLNKQNRWRWPKREHHFISDLHADPDAFAASLVASGSVKQTGPCCRDFRLTKAGGNATFVIGGDCFDKGPSNLELLRCVRQIKDQGARMRILAGNHDIRLLFGMRVVGERKDVRNEHFFIRSGQKIIPLIQEVWATYLSDRKLKSLPNLSTCRSRLFPRQSWFDDFPKICEDAVVPSQVDREISRIAKKADRFEALCGQQGLDLRQVYAATRQWKKLFLKKSGEFYWFYRNLRLCYQSGSLLFVHAGVDDTVAEMLWKHGAGRLNDDFRLAMAGDPFDSYYGPLCNSIRTKYRDVDRPFTAKGAKHMHRAGITAILHGHRNLHHGQRLSLRESQINFECDTSLDSHTRRVENVGGRGASVTIVQPRGRILGVSSDFPQIKVFEPVRTLATLRANIKHEGSKR